MGKSGHEDSAPTSWLEEALKEASASELQAAIRAEKRRRWELLEKKHEEGEQDDRDEG